MDIERGRAFVHAHGSPIERARLTSLLDGHHPDSVPPELAALQNPDGGFPFDLRIGNPSTLNHTALVLGWLADLDHARSAVGRGAATFLLSRQTVRGIWRESRDLQRFPLPLWMDPESAAADVYTTALCSATLIHDPNAGLALDRAAAWLQTQQGRDGQLPGFKLHASWLAVPVFAEIAGEDSRPTRRLIAGLGEALSDEWAPSMLAAMLLRLLDAGYGPRTALVARAWQLLEAAQEPDGSFKSEDEQETPVTSTIMALAVARKLGQGAP